MEKKREKDISTVNNLFIPVSESELQAGPCVTEQEEEDKMLGRILSFLFPRSFVLASENKCQNLLLPEVKPALTLAPEVAEKLINYLPIVWYKSPGRKKMLIIVHENK